MVCSIDNGQYSDMTQSVNLMDGTFLVNIYLNGSDLGHGNRRPSGLCVILLLNTLWCAEIGIKRMVCRNPDKTRIAVSDLHRSCKS